MYNCFRQIFPVSEIEDPLGFSGRGLFDSRQSSIAAGERYRKGGSFFLIWGLAT